MLLSSHLWLWAMQTAAQCGMLCSSESLQQTNSTKTASLPLTSTPPLQCADRGPVSMPLTPCMAPGQLAANGCNKLGPGVDPRSAAEHVNITIIQKEPACTCN